MKLAIYSMVVFFGGLMSGCHDIKPSKTSVFAESKHRQVFQGRFEVYSNRSFKISGVLHEPTEGVRVEIPPFAFSYPGRITLRRLNFLVSHTLSGQLGLAKHFHFIPASQAWHLNSFHKKSASIPVQVSLPINIEIDEEELEAPLYLVVIYKIYDEKTGTNRIGMIPPEEIRRYASGASFNTYGFGSFQFAYTDLRVENRIEKSYQGRVAPLKILGNAKDDRKLEFNAKVNQKTRRIKIEIEGDSFVGCTIIKDRDRKMPYDEAYWHQDGNDVIEPAVNGGTEEFYIRAECDRKDGQIVVSKWSDQLRVDPIKTQLKGNIRPDIWRPTFSVTVTSQNAVSYRWGVASDSEDECRYVGLSEPIPIGQQDTTEVETNGQKILCLKGIDANGVEQPLATSYRFQKHKNTVNIPSRISFLRQPLFNRKYSGLDEVSVAIVDSLGATVTEYQTGHINLNVVGTDEIKKNYASAKIRKGVAKFTNLKLKESGSFRLEATHKGFSSVISIPFSIHPKGEPIFRRFHLANEATDGYINQFESSSLLPAFSFHVEGFTSLDYSAFNEEGSLEKCSESVKYPSTEIPKIAEIPSKDGRYFICVRGIASDGRIYFYKSKVIEKDTRLPEVILFNGTNSAADHLLNLKELSSTDKAYNILAVDFHRIDFSHFVQVESECGKERSFYPLSSMPTINQLEGKMGIFKVCALVVDAAGNRVFSSSIPLTVDSSLPKFMAIHPHPYLSDGMINRREIETGFSYIQKIEGNNYVAQKMALMPADSSCERVGDWYDKLPGKANELLPDGKYKICLLLINRSGNELVSSAIEFSVDKESPTLGYTPTTFFASEAAKIDFLPVGASQYLWSSVDKKLSIKNNSSAASIFEANQEGSYPASFKAWDHAGNEVHHRFLFVLDKTPPFALLEEIVWNDKETKFVISIANPDVEFFRYKYGESLETDCRQEEGYSDRVFRNSEEWISWTDLQELKLCLIGQDKAGNWQPFEFSSIYLWDSSRNSPSQQRTH